MSPTYRYAAFISYSNADSAFAKRVHRALESYHIPATVGPVRLTDDARSENRLYPVFRDREEMPSGPLAEGIERALNDSGALIVICSPSSASSHWVDREVRYFEGLGRRDRIFAIVAAGEPNASGQGREQDECFPPALRATERARLGEPELEIVAGDARSGQDGFRNAWLKVVAGMIGVSVGVLRERDREQRRRRLLQNSALTVAIALIGLAGVAWSMAESQRIQLRDHASLLLRSGELREAVAFAVAGMHPPGSILAGSDDDAAEVLLSTGYVLKQVVAFDDASDVQLLPGGRLLATDTTGHRSLWDSRTGHKLLSLGLASGFGAGVEVALGRPLVGVDQGNDGLGVWDLAARKQVFQVGGNVQEARFSPGGKRLLTRSLKDGGVLWDTATGARLITAPGIDHIGDNAFSANGTRLWLILSGTQVGHLRPGQLWDVNTGQKLAELGPLDGVWNARFSKDGNWLAVQYEDDSGALWNARTGTEVGVFAPGGQFADAEISPRSDRLLVVLKDSRASLWRLWPLTKLAELGGPGAGWSHEWSPNGTRILTRGEKGDAALWDAASGLRLANLGAGGAVVSDVFSDDGARLVVIRKSGAAEIFNARTGKPSARLDNRYAAIIRSHGNRLVLSQADGRAMLVAFDTAQVIADLGTLDAGDGADFLDGGKLLLHSRDGAFSLWDAGTGTRLGFQIAGGGARSVEVSSDGTRLVVDYGSDRAALFDTSVLARGPLTGSAVRAAVCSQNAGALTRFKPDDRAPTSPFAHALKGRPWQPCDWRGLWQARGWVQALRYWAVRLGFPWDYVSSPPSSD